MKTLRLVLLVTSLLLVSALTAEARNLRVFILSGQSNMQGQGFIAADPKHNGGKGSLEYVAKNPATAASFKQLLNPDGSWATRKDVWIADIDRHGPLTVGYGVNPERIGPELGFGWVMGDYLEDPVLLIKCSWGGKSLAVDFRPPSSGPIPYELKGKQKEELEKNPEVVGHYYREILRITRETLGNFKKTFPELADCQPILTGFGWHQGWNDRIDDKFNAEYEKNFVNFVNDMRRDLNAPKLPIVIAETGMGGSEEKHPRALSLMKAQADAAAHPEFKGNVAFVGTKAFWRPTEESPSNQGYHWNTNAETYYLIGDAMGKAMEAMLDPKLLKPTLRK